LIQPEEAWRLLELHLEPLARERLARRDAAGRVLAETVHSKLELPAHDVSAMDGYAVSHPIHDGDRLPVVGTIAAGDPPGFDLPPAAAARIMTGAPAPAETEAVVPIEDTDRGIQQVVFHRDSTPGQHIRRQGEILAAKELMLAAGTLLTPGALSLLATHGYSSLSVYGAPRVATLSTGDEVVSPETEPEAGQLRDSHTDFLLAAGKSLGLGFFPLGIAADSREEIESYLQRGLEHDLLLVTGGVSMGAFDFVGEVLADLGCEVLFDKVAVQPGKPLVAARHGRGWVFGLPGNPASVMVCFWLFVRPTLRRLLGLHDGFWHGALRGRLVGDLTGAKGRDRFLPASIAFEDGEILVRPVAPKGSHDLLAYAHGNALVRVRPHAAPAHPGDACEVLPLPDWPSTLRTASSRGSTANITNGGRKDPP
jgi:molybdopterin molybdotransferase